MYELPEMCYSMLEPSNTLIIIKRNEDGYFPYKGYNGQPVPTTQEYVDSQNEILGVTKAQRKAMEHGSMFGWDKPIADPKLWEEKLLKQKSID